MRPYVLLVVAVLYCMVITSCQKSEDVVYYDKISLNVGSSVSMMKGESFSVEISQGSGKFDVTTDCNKIDATLENGKIKIMAMEKGESCCYIYDVLTREERLLKVIVFDNSPTVIDN